MNEHKRQFGRCEDAPCCGCCGGDEQRFGDDFASHGGDFADDDFDDDDFDDDDFDDE